MGYSIQIIDESKSDHPVTSLAIVSDSHFKQFITSVSDHVLAKVGKVASASHASPEKAQVKLLFVRRPLLRADGAPVLAATALSLPQVDRGRRLDSPWVKATITSPSNCTIRAVFVWSERQLLLDRALLSGATAWPNEPLIPIESSAFATLKVAYEEFALSAPKIIQGDAVAERIPPDILWLFRQSWPSTRARSTFTEAKLQLTVAHASGTYTIFVKGILDRILNSTKDEEELRLESVFDLRERRSTPAQHHNSALR
jgi:hypothetical protein